MFGKRDYTLKSMGNLVKDFTTLGGLAMFLIGRIPKAGDTFTYKNLQFEVVDMDRGRVDKLLVIRKEEEEE